MKITKIEVRERQQKVSWERGRPVREYTERQLNGATRVYVFHDGENVLEGFGNRAARPSAAYKKAFGEQIAEMLFVKVSDLRWSQKAGCSCGCSPGFVVRGSYRKDVFVTVAADEPRTTDPELAANRVGQLLADPTIVGAIATGIAETEDELRWKRLM